MKIFNWVKRNILALLGGVIAIFLAIFGIQYYRSKLGKVKDQLVVEKSLSKIAELKGKKDELQKSATASRAEIDNLDKELHSNKRAIVEAHENGKGLTDTEMLKEFEALGY